MAQQCVLYTRKEASAVNNRRNLYYILKEDRDKHPLSEEQKQALFRLLQTSVKRPGLTKPTTKRYNYTKK